MLGLIDARLGSGGRSPQESYNHTPGLWTPSGDRYDEQRYDVYAARATRPQPLQPDQLGALMTAYTPASHRDLFASEGARALSELESRIDQLTVHSPDGGDSATLRAAVTPGEPPVEVVTGINGFSYFLPVSVGYKGSPVAGGATLLRSDREVPRDANDFGPVQLRARDPNGTSKIGQVEIGTHPGRHFVTRLDHLLADGREPIVTAQLGTDSSGTSLGAFLQTGPPTYAGISALGT
jgi:hypothetical protein